MKKQKKTRPLTGQCLKIISGFCTGFYQMLSILKPSKKYQFHHLKVNTFIFMYFLETQCPLRLQQNQMIETMTYQVLLTGKCHKLFPKSQIKRFTKNKSGDQLSKKLQNYPSQISKFFIKIWNELNRSPISKTFLISCNFKNT